MVSHRCVQQFGCAKCYELMITTSSMRELGVWFVSKTQIGRTHIIYNLYEGLSTRAPLQQDTDVHSEEECLTLNEQQQQVSVPLLLKTCLIGFYSRIKNDGFFSSKSFCWSYAFSFPRFNHSNHQCPTKHVACLTSILKYLQT